MPTAHELRTSEQRLTLFDSHCKRIDKLLLGHEHIKARVRVPMVDNRYMVGFDSLDNFDKGECEIELSKDDDGFVFSIGDTIVNGRRRKIGLPNYRERNNNFDSEVFDRFIITGDLDGFEMFGFSDGVEIPILAAPNYEPAEDLFATCIFALENHQRSEAKLRA